MTHRLSIMGPIRESSFFEPDTVSAQDVQAFVAQLPDDGEELLVGPVMTPGGSIAHGTAVRQILENETSRRPVTFEVYGVAGSIGAHLVVGTRGARVRMARDAELMIHPPWWDIGPASSGEHAAAAESLAPSAKSIVDAMVHRAPSIDGEALLDHLVKRSAMSWYTVPAATAVELGLADEIIETPDPELAAQAAEVGAATAPPPPKEARMEASLPLKTPAAQAGQPAPPAPQPASPAPAATSAPQASIDEESLFQRLWARFSAMLPARTEQAAPEPAAAPALPFAFSTPTPTPAPAVSATAAAEIFEVSAQTYATARTSAMCLPSNLSAMAASLAPMKVAEMAAEVNHRTAVARGDANEVATTAAAHAAAQQSLASFEGVLQAASAAIRAAGVPLTTESVGPVAVAAHGDAGEGDLADAHVRLMIARGVATPAALARAGVRVPQDLQEGAPN